MTDSSPGANWLAERRTYRDLDDARAACLARFSVGLLADDRRRAEHQLRMLSCFQPQAIRTVQEALLEARCFYPGRLFLDAAPNVRDALIELLEAGAENQHQLLVCLSWIRDDVVRAAFSSWRDRHQQT
jgi:hypothetical protein